MKSDDRKAYTELFQEYERLGYMTKLSKFSISDRYFIPHHLVNSKRIVFSASFVDNSDISLNNYLLDGPVLQSSLRSHVNRFRTYLVAVTADIFRMYRSILVYSEDRKFQMIIFRYLSLLPINFYELNTLVNGFGLASYISTKCLDKIADFIELLDKSISDIVRRHKEVPK